MDKLVKEIDSGRVFSEALFFPNIKCMVFSYLMMILYMLVVAFARVSCEKNLYKKTDIIVLVLIYFVAYIAMGWYDLMYDCNTKLTYSQSLNPDVLFKPKTKEQEESLTYMRTVWMFHASLIGPLLLYIGLYNKIPSPGSLAFIGGLATVYHGFKFVNSYTKWV